MGADAYERRNRGGADRPKTPSKHPIAAIEKRVIDSEAFAALPPSAVCVLLLLARNLDKGRNGHCFVSADDAERHGIDRKTLYRQLKNLVTTGFIFPTSRGGNGRCSTYALTWLPLSKDTNGLRVDNFRPCAWRDWKAPAGDKKRLFRVGKKSSERGQKRVKTPASLDGNGSRDRDKSPYLELNTNTQGEKPERIGGNAAAWIPDYIERLGRADLRGYQCFQIPPGGALQ